MVVPQNEAQIDEAPAPGEDIYIRGGQGPMEGPPCCAPYC